MAKGKWAPGAGKKPQSKSLSGAPNVNSAASNHFATRERANDFTRLLRALPDKDPVLKRMGKGIAALQELLTDSHLESVWSVRCSAASGAEWFIAPAEGSGAKGQQAARAFAEELKGIDVPRVIEEMMDAVAYGYSPLEVIWTPKDGRWGIADIVGKPPQWFEFDQENTLKFKAKNLGNEELPVNRFLLVQHRPTYANPYGVKVFSKCYWPVTFKRNGFRWWTVYTEKYGGAFLHGEYPINAGEQFKSELLAALEKMASDSVAIAPEGSKITIISAADKSGGSNIHSKYIQMTNAEISKAVLGETLTTEIGEAGSYAAAQTHNLVREDIAAADRQRVSAAFNRLAAFYTFYNFGESAAPPLFQFVKDEDLRKEKAERDVDLYKTGFRPNKEYFKKEYGMREEDFDVQEAGGLSGGFSRHAPARSHYETRSCARENASKKRSIFIRVSSLFASKEIKELNRDEKLLEGFELSILKAAQEETDLTVDTLLGALGQAKDYDEAFEALVSAYNSLSPERFAELLGEARYAAIQIGAKTGTKGGRRG